MEFQCGICKSLFKYNNSLKRHIKTVHLTERINCHICTETFTRRDSLYRHIRSQHHCDNKQEECNEETVNPQTWESIDIQVCELLETIVKTHIPRKQEQWVENLFDMYS